MKKSSSSFFQFLEDSHASVPSLRAELSDAGVALTRLESRVGEILAQHRPQNPKPASWMETARQLQQRFEKKFQAKTTWVSDQFRSAQELAQAIQRGELGLGLQTQAQVYFRDQDLEKVSEKDLRSFARDQEILVELELEEQKKS